MMQPATFVINGEGRKSFFCPVPNDPVGLYVLFFSQGATHGSEKISENAPLLPVMFSPASMSDATLQTQLLRHWKAHKAVAVAVDSSKKTRDGLVRAWQNDLLKLGGKLPSGRPNSRSTGIQRSNGLCFGSFATKTRAHEELRRCWKLLALALGRDDPFPKPTRGAIQPAVLTSFDGILFTEEGDDFKGLKPHQDTFPPPHGETGQLQGLVYVHPPPPKVLRLGCAVAFYPVRDHELWRAYMLSLVTRWSTSPDLDLRQSPLPGLGSKTGPGKHKFVLGGPQLPKKDAAKLSDAELKAAAQKLPQPLRTLAKNACQKKTHTRNEREYLKQWCSLACWAWPQDYHSYVEERLQLLKDIRDGKATRKEYSANLIRSAKDCTARADKFGAPEKLNTWLLQGGRKKRLREDILQPSGATTRAQKKVGSQSTFGAKKKCK